MLGVNGTYRSFKVKWINTNTVQKEKKCGRSEKVKNKAATNYFPRQINIMIIFLINHFSCKMLEMVKTEWHLSLPEPEVVFSYFWFSCFVQQMYQI